MPQQAIIAIAAVMGLSLLMGVFAIFRNKTSGKKSVIAAEQWIKEELKKDKAVVRYTGNIRVFKVNGQEPSPQDVHKLMGAHFISLAPGSHNLTYQFNTTNVTGSNFKTKKETLAVNVQAGCQYDFTLGNDAKYYQNYDIIVPLSAFGKSVVLVFGQASPIDFYKRDFKVE